MSAKGVIFIVSAPSGAGKTSLVRRIIEEVPRITVAVSHTTRPMREGDTDGGDYHFVSREEFERLIEEGAFLEHADVFGNYYGTSSQAVETCISDGSDVILEIDWQGAVQIRNRLEGTCSIFILPPSREVLLERLRGRGTDSDEVIERRTREAVAEMKQMDTADYILVNDQFDPTLVEFKSVILAARLRADRQIVEHQQMINGLLSG